MNGRKVTVRVTLDAAGVRLATLVLLATSLTGSVVWAQEASVPAPAPRDAPLAQAASGRHYYLTAAATYSGGAAPAACASGYHMASLWEILDVSNLIYDTSLGYQIVPGDGGEGPPTNVDGWIRTGASSSIGPTQPGQHNCAMYTFSTAGMFGTTVSLPSNWSSPGSDVGVWVAATADCSSAQRVWCVED